MLIAIVATIAGGIVLCVLVSRLMARSRRRQRSAPRPAPSPGARLEPLIDPDDAAELEARWDALDADHRRRHDELLGARLRPLVDRRVPVRVVEPIPARKVVRIRFADGTAVVGRGEIAGDTGVLASLIRKQSVWPGSFTTDAAGTHVVFAWSGGRCVTVLVTGLDQPD